jgi:phosphate/sulfate permease
MWQRIDGAAEMDQKAYLAVTAMLNSFPQGNNNPDLTMGTYEAVLRDASSQAITEAAQRFTTGKVQGQSKTFAPSVAEFIAEVERRQELIDIQAKPRLPPPQYFPGPLAPFQIRQQKRLAENAHRPVLFENINFDQWRKLSANREIPVGAIWVASLGIVYGPDPKLPKVEYNS